MAGRLPGVHLNKKGHEQATGGGREAGWSADKSYIFKPSGESVRDSSTDLTGTIIARDNPARSD